MKRNDRQAVVGRAGKRNAARRWGTRAQRLAFGFGRDVRKAR